MTVIDTSLFIDAQRGREPARARLAQLLRASENVAISAMTILEIRAVPRMSAAWSTFFAKVFAALEIIELDREAAEDGARLSRDMARRGFKLHNADAAVAGCAVRAGAAAIVTSDADFTELRGLRIEYVQPS